MSTELAADATLHRGIAEVEAESVALMVGAIRSSARPSSPAVRSSGCDP